MNYYDTHIKSEKVTQELAAQIFKRLTEQSKIRFFNYSGAGSISYNSRGVVNIDDLLAAANINQAEVSVKSEFEQYEEAESFDNIVVTIHKS